MVNTETTLDVDQPADRVAGLVAEFESIDAVVAAAGRVREEGYRRWDVHSPFPIHGIEEKMGIRMTILPFLVLGAGISGGTVALFLQWYANAVEYPLIISGKPLFSLPANIPVTFELIVLFSALTAFFGSLALSLLPQFKHPVFSSEAFARATNDRFFISLEAADKKFDEANAKELLTSLGATAVETCREPAKQKGLPAPTYWALAIAGILACFPPLVVAWKRAAPSSTPRVQILKDMDSQPSFKAQTTSPLFLDRRSNRPDIAGTIARGHLETDKHLQLGQVDGFWVATFPESIPQTLQTMKRGQDRYNVYCATCHGLAGDGDGMTAQRATRRAELNWRPPTRLFAPGVLEQPLGQIYNTVKNGKGTMPAYRGQIPVDDRWAIVMYVKALQRGRTAKLSDVPEDERAALE